MPRRTCCCDFFLIWPALPEPLGQRHHVRVVRGRPGEEGLLSKAQPDAASEPFTSEAAQAMLRDTVVVPRARQMVSKMLRFWGIDGDTISISNQPRFNAKLRRANHNQLRMTRVSSKAKSTSLWKLIL